MDDFLIWIEKGHIINDHVTQGLPPNMQESSHPTGVIEKNKKDPEGQSTEKQVIDVMDEDIPYQEKAHELVDQGKKIRELEDEVVKKYEIFVEVEGDINEKEDDIQELETKVNDLKSHITKLNLDVKGE